MTIAVNGRFLGARRTGLQRVGRELLVALQSRGAPETTVLAPVGVDDPLVDRHVARTPAGRAGGLAWEQVVFPFAARGPVLSLANTGPVVARRAALLVHDLAPLTEPAWFARSMQLYAHVSLLAARRAAVVCTVSAVIADELVARGVRSARIRVVRPAVGAEFVPAPAPDVDAVRERLGIVGQYVVLVGMHDPRKGAWTALAAHRAVVGAQPHHLVLVGGPRANLAPVDVGHDPSVVTTGHVDDTTLRALLTGAEALLFPSLAEGFGLPPLEAQACGTPAVVSDLPVLRETAGPTALRVPVGDVDAWAGALRAALAHELPPPTRPTRTWADAADELAHALDAL